MKKINIIFTTLFFALSTMPVFALTVSGTVSDKDGPLAGASVRPLDANGNPIPNIGRPTNENGEFNFSIPDNATKLQISYMGYKTQRVNAEANLNIKLEDDSRILDEPIIIPTECTENQEQALKNTQNAKEVEWKNGKCVIKSCIGELGEYEIQNNSCVKVNCNSAEIANLKNAQSTKVVNGKCVIDECIGEPGEYKKSDYICEKAKCTKAEESDLKTNHHAKKVTVRNGKCVSTDCVTGYHTDNDVCVKDECESSEEDWIDGKGCTKVRCTADEIQGVLNANGTDPKWNGKECVPTDCVNGYHLNNKNKCIHDKCTKPEEDWDESLQKCVQVRCSDEQIRDANATSKSKWNKQTQRCEFACDTAAGFTLNSQNKCEQTLCSEKDAKRMIKNNVSKYELQNGVCIATDCISNDYEITRDRTACKNKKCKGPEFDVVNGNCVQKRCTDAQKKEKHSEEEYWDGEKCVATKCDEKIYTLDTSKGECVKIDQRSDEEKKKDLEDKQKAYEEAKAKEQSFENRMLTAVTTAATGIGGMELAQGLAEQKSDKAADADMTAYIETMRCTYGDGKQVKAGPDEIELPGANNQELMNLRGQYLALAQDLKERKTALGMKPGIESEVIYDRATSGLYDEENIGITNGNYASLYRAKMLESEEDQKKIDDAASTSKKRVTGGAIAAGAGVVVGIAGNSLINGKLGELLKNKKDTKNLEEAAKVENDALNELKTCLKKADVKYTDKLKFDSFPPSALSVDNINCKNDLKKAKNKTAQDLFADTVDADRVLNKLIDSFGAVVAGKMIGVTLSNNPTNDEKDRAKATLTEAFDATNKRINEATEKDEEVTNSSGPDALAKVLDSSGVGNTVSSLLGNNDQSTDSSDADKKKSDAEIRKCITQINKRVVVDSPNEHYLRIYKENGDQYCLLYRDPDANKLSPKLVKDYPYIHDERSREKPTSEEMDACDVLTNVNNFITNDECPKK